MYTENGPAIDLPEVLDVIRTSDVFGVGFRMSPERLLVDTRSSDVDGPFIGVVEPVNSIEERMFWLGQHRPRFGMPQRFAFLFWPHSTRHFVDTGVWDAIREELAESGHASAVAQTERALADLRQLEREATIDAITGDQHRTLWQAEGKGATTD